VSVRSRSGMARDKRARDKATKQNQCITCAESWRTKACLMFTASGSANINPRKSAIRLFDRASQATAIARSRKASNAAIHSTGGPVIDIAALYPLDNSALERR